MTEPRSLAAHLRGWSDAQRMQLFEWRPDLMTPAPRSSAQLAARATTTASVARALDFLTAWELRVLAALLDGTSARTDVVAALPGSEAAIDRLSQLALIWGQDRLRPVGTVAQIGISPDPTATPTPPTLATTPIDPTHVARAAGGAAFDFVRRTELLLEHWGLRPPGVLKAGGLGVRELRASAVLLGVEAQDAALVVEVAAEARLIGQGQSRATGPAWMPTTDFDDWMLLDNPQRWARLAQAWLDSPRFVAGWRSKDTQGRSLNAFDPALSRRWLPQARRDVLGALALLGPDEALAAGTGAASLVAYLRWSAPRRPGSGETVASSIVAEAARLGLVALGALTPPGRALLARDDAAAVIEAHLPRPVEQILIQADLTAVSHGPLTTEIGTRLGLVADVESRGAATVYRFTQDSIRRGLDAGLSSAEITAFLHQVSASPVPQALDYLVNDMARRFGNVRLGQARCYVRADDETALTELMAHASAATLGLRRLAPTVAVSELDITTVLTRLRDSGAAPALEAADGTLKVVKPEQMRSKQRYDPRSAAFTQARQIAQRQSAIDLIKSGDRAERERPPGAAATSSADVIALLSEAAASETPVWLYYLDAQGRSNERVVRPQALRAGVLTSYDEVTGQSLDVSVHRIRSASLAPASAGP